MMEVMTLKDHVAADGRKYGEAWTLIEDENFTNKWENDCADDVSNLYIGARL